jgi:alpha-tubulin suppressor-like RCC1 family protein
VDTLFSANRDSVRLVAAGVGVDTVTVTHALCVGICSRTMVVRVEQEAHSILVTTGSGQDTVTLRSFGEADTLRAVVRDRRGNAIAGAPLAWSYAPGTTAADSAAVQLDGNVVTAGANSAEAVEVVAVSGAATATAGIRVWQAIHRLQPVPDHLTLVGNGAQDTLRMEGFDARDHRVLRPFTAQWSARDADVASVQPLTGDPTAAVVTALVHQGTTRVDGSAEGVAAEIEVDVIPPIMRMEVTPRQATINALGFQRQLEAMAYDSANVALSGVTFRWSSSDTTVARVDAGGLVTAHGVGQALVIASLGSQADTAEVTVRQILRAIEVEPTGSVILTGDTLVLTAAARDSAGAAIPGYSFVWSSSDPATATVTQEGVVTGLREGSATITAEAGGMTGSAAINVLGQVLRVAAGADHTCTISDEGRVYCWGANGHGRLGDGTSANRIAPVQVVSSQLFEEIAAGWSHTCAISDAGAVYCWGNGQLTGGGSNRHAPTLLSMPGGITAKKITAGNEHTCVIGSDNQVYCWGAGGNGQLGNGSAAHANTPVAIQAVGFSWVTVEAGQNHTCAATSGGDVYCWGYGVDGQLGDGTQSYRYSPVRVDISGVSFNRLSAGIEHTCALTTNGVAYCWGGNGSSQLGDGTNTRSLRPVQVAGGHTFREIASAFWGGSCAVTATDQRYCWGGNWHGQQGTGTVDGSNQPVLVTSGPAMRSLAGGHDGMCGISTAGVVYCWGSRGTGRIGDGLLGHATAPQAVPGVPAGSTVYMQHNSAGCALAPDGAAYCWGYNQHGQLGRGTQTLVETAGLVVTNERFTSLAIGSHHTCGLRADGDLYCWGANWDGQLGLGHLDMALVPQKVNVPGVSFSSVTAGGNFTCGIATDGQGYCWGMGSNGRLGTGNTTSRNVPTPIALTSQLTTISSGQAHTCAVTQSGTMFCWGDGGLGQLGNNSGSTSVATPTPVSGAIAWATVEAGQRHTCALASTGAAYCWGDNHAGQLGENTNSARYQPTLVQGGRSYSSLTAGWATTCGISGADVYCWGANWNSQFGNGTTTSSWTPVLIALGFTPTKLAIGQNTTCASTSAGVQCWGYREQGLLGDGTRHYTPHPTQVGHP